MEAVVRTVTCSGPRKLSHAESLARRPRHWLQLTGFKGIGRYVPDTARAAAAADGVRTSSGAGAVEAQPAAAARQSKRASKGTVALESWLRQMTTLSGADEEVNVQLGEFSLRKQSLAPLPPPIRAHPDVEKVVGAATDSSETLQSVRVSATTERRWYRLVGRRMDIHVWGADSRSPSPVARSDSDVGVRRKYSPNQADAHVPEWLRQTLEPVRCAGGPRP